MNITEKDWFCHQCFLQFGSKHIYNLHLKLMHKHINAKRSNKNKLKTIEQISIDENSDSIIQIISYWTKTLKCDFCQYCTSQKGHLKSHVLQFMKERSHSNACFATILVLKRITWINMLLQFMNERSPSYASFATIVVLKEVAWKHMLLLFMKGRSHSNVSFAIILALQRVTWIGMMLQFIKKTSHSNVSYAIILVQQNKTWIDMLC